jgi:acyl-coenzyme A synthetase/AMP-(fatty) acid ligase
MTTMNAAETLLEAGDDDAVAIECDDLTISYRQLRAAVARAGGAWQALGLRPGDRVIVFAPDSIDWIVAYLGVIWAGGVAIGVNSRLSMDDLAPIVTESTVSAVWCEPEHAAGIGEITHCVHDSARRVDVSPQIVVAGPSAVGGWHAMLAEAKEVEAMPRDAEDPALWIGTSGTTGIPKGVIHAQRVVLDANSFACGLLGLTAKDRLYASSKLFFAYALGNSLLAGLRSGATVILDREWPTAERVGEMVRKHRPSLLFSVPTLYHKMLQSGVAKALAEAGIRHFVSAGEALPPAVRQGWRDATGKQMISGYGTSETLCLMLYSDRDDGTMAPTPLTEVRFRDDLDADMPQRIRVRSRTVALGYWQRPEAQADGFSDRWYSPGDLFLRRDDGRLEYAGRNDDMLKIAGQWVSTLWVEQALAAACSNSVEQLASVGVTTNDGLTALAVLAVAAPGQTRSAARKMDEGIAGLPKHRRPRWVHWLDALPVTATGKLQRGQLRRLHEAALASGD